MKWPGASVPQHAVAAERTDQRMQALEARAKTLEAELQALKARPMMVYQGVHERGIAYRPGHCVTAKGCLWHCNAVTSEVPGESRDWTLAVKRGRDAR